MIIDNYLTNSAEAVRLIDDHGDKACKLRMVRPGVPQGSIISLIFFLFTLDITKILQVGLYYMYVHNLQVYREVPTTLRLLI